MSTTQNVQNVLPGHGRNVIDMDWGLVVKLVLPEKVTRRAYLFRINDRFLTKVQLIISFKRP
jgi:hypothetical protein